MASIQVNGGAGVVCLLIFQAVCLLPDIAQDERVSLANYLQLEQREQAAKVAQSCGVPLLILDCQAPEHVMLEWLAERQAAGTDPSDASAEVIAAQQSSRQPLTTEELQYSQTVFTHDAVSMNTVVEQIRSKLPPAP